jgi:hypothetical protein
MPLLKPGLLKINSPLKKIEELCAKYDIEELSYLVPCCGMIFAPIVLCSL